MRHRFFELELKFEKVLSYQRRLGVVLMGSIFLFSLSSIPRADGGGSMTGGGGGDAVACFQTVEQRDLALNADGSFRDSAFGGLVSLETVDLWDEPDYLKNFFPISKNDTPEAYLRRALEAWHTVLPEFSNRVFEATSLVQTRLRTSQLNQPSHVVYDTGRIGKSLPAHCRLVGIVNRFTVAHPGGYPQLSFSVDQRLFDRLGQSGAPLGQSNARERKVLHQADILLHEALFVLGVESGDKNSQPVRLINQVLLSRTSFESVIAKPKDQQKSVALDLIMKADADRFLVLFPKEYSNSGVKFGRFSKETRGQSWLSYRKKYNACVNQWLSQHQKSELDPDTLFTPGVLTPAEQANAARFVMDDCIPTSFTPEEAFLLVANGVFVNQGIESSLALVVAGVDDEKQFSTVCQKILVLSENVLLFGHKTLVLSREYCRQRDRAGSGDQCF